jgi:hypothetical protein
MGGMTVPVFRTHRRLAGSRTARARARSSEPVVGVGSRGRIADTARDIGSACGADAVQELAFDLTISINRGG